MYPYNAKTQLYNAPLRSRNRQETAPLSSDNRLRELLLLARETAAQTEQTYEALSRDERLFDAQDILHTMQMDEKKHRRILQDALFSIYGDTAEHLPQIEKKADCAAEDAEELLEALLLAEMDEVSFYRDLLFSMDTAELWGFFYEIITNKQNHCAALNHLYAKYFVKSIVKEC